MEIIVAKSAGYCFGVKRAIDMVEEVLSNSMGKRIYSLGEIIHNPQVVKRLKDRGLMVVLDVGEVEKESIVVISAHGRSEKDIYKLKEKKCMVIDATCPFVKFPQSVIKKLSKENYFIILFGDNNHPEVKALISYSKPQNIAVVDSFDVNFELFKASKVGVLAQTTQNKDDFMQLVCMTVKKFKECRVFNTICDATNIRQDETISIAKNVDIMVVIGGRNSANTKRLYEISKLYCKKVIHIETEKELDMKIFDGINKVGVTAGASTPQDIIKEVVKKIKSSNR
ncbi:MAG: 4-hydroxy-3-methylbut-2-enyl diphosphate reductase [Deltaproteobacteria bacterium]|nr:4-hydroxy-3-methylbut-2-enyl diphosphate reductase [Deltaproteobacteria bacterium]